MKITTDVDGVLAKFTEQFIDFINARYKYDLDISQITRLKFEDILHLDSGKISEYLMEFKDSGGHLKVEPIEGSIEGIEKLSKKHEIHIVTSRRKDVCGDETIEWLEKYYPNKFKSINMKELSNEEQDRGVYKRIKIAEISPDFHIEDDIDHISHVKELPLTIVMYSQPWNVGYSDPKILKAKNWEEIVDYLD